VWDGLFHAFVWLVTLLGVLLLWSAAYHQETMPALGAFIGQLLFGWGLFNLVEGIIDHQILGVHYVRQVPNYTVYNLTFLAVGGVGLLLVGWLLMKTRRRDVIESDTPRRAGGLMSRAASKAAGCHLPTQTA
jgi:uncharacterized membrane protein